MGAMDPKAHWEQVYGTKRPDEVSWFQQEPGVSLSWIRRSARTPDARIIDVGGGASSLVDHLLRDGYVHPTVLDLSRAALDAARARLGANAAAVTWLESDIRTAALPAAAFDVWHDRAVFHFLTEPADRAAYVAQAERAVRPGGVLVIATFADDGPLKCSGLPVARYSADELSRAFAAGFEPLDTAREMHVTPAGGRQSFVYCLSRRRSA